MPSAYNDSMFEFVISWFFVCQESLQLSMALGKLSKIEYKKQRTRTAFLNGG
ncbi:hypothetical protein GCM10019991_19620 [Enterococcus casseliflavus]|jgi:hypothetical protein